MTQNALGVIAQFTLAPRLYLIGTYESGVTIYSQQVRALNLAWAMVEGLPGKELEHVAVIGGGFAGLTLAAGLLKKGVAAVTIFEKRAVFCPLQQGSDTRWVHPHIYNWPAEESELPSAALPLLNWTAGRASDVAVHVLREWGALKASCSGVVQEIKDAKYLRIETSGMVDWVSSLGGDTKSYGSVVLALGFGEERDREESATPSYWRNESFGQPELSAGTKVYLISGYGDGALVDLFRIRIDQFRQDRILAELFRNRNACKHRLATLKIALDKNEINSDEIYGRFQDLARKEAGEFTGLLDDLRGKLRRDTNVVLRIRSKAFSSIFAHRSSFQNKFLLYCLFRIGAFIPSDKPESELRSQFHIDASTIVRRHGTRPDEPLEAVLSPALLRDTKTRRQQLSATPNQSDTVAWSGGYWDQLHPKFGRKDESREKWRQEYLPAPTELLAAAFSSSIAGLMDVDGKAGDHRVTLHRVIRIGTEALLQQCCDYQGRTSRKGKKGRTFGVDQGTIGLAYRQKRVCRTSPADVPDHLVALRADMKALQLGKDSQEMSNEVRSLLAIPIVANGSSIMVLYADSTTKGIFSDALTGGIVKALEAFCHFLDGLEIEGMRNFAGRAVQLGKAESGEPPVSVIEQLDTKPPTLTNLVGLNLEVASFDT